MLYISLTLILLWLGTLIYAQNVSKDLKWVDTPISNFIRGSKHLQVGFVLLQGSFQLQGIDFYSISKAQGILFGISSIGSLGVMLTKKSTNSIIHGIQQVLTYFCQFCACIIVGSIVNQILLGLQISNLLYQLFGQIIKDEIGDLERYLALGLIQWFIQYLIL